MKTWGLSAVICLLATSSLSGATFLMRFEVTNFSSLNGNPPPTDPIIGTIMWEATGIRDPNLSIQSINMTIDGHSYSVGELAYEPDSYYDNAIIGGGPAARNMPFGADDFWIRWDHADTLLPYDFAYVSSKTPGMWYTSWFGPNSPDSFSIIEVPEPSAAALFLSMMPWLFFRRRANAV